MAEDDDDGGGDESAIIGEHRRIQQKAIILVLYVIPKSAIKPDNGYFLRNDRRKCALSPSTKNGAAAQDNNSLCNFADQR